MAYLGRRLERLEKRLGVRHAYSAPMEVIQAALEQLSYQHLEHFIQAEQATRQGRPLSKAESDARQAYAYALEREWRRAGFHSRCEFERWYRKILKQAKR
jgi:hypothetical protein